MNNTELTLDQELSINELEDINGAALPLLAAWGMGVATGAGVKYLYDNREVLADAVHDLISAEDNAKCSGKTGVWAGDDGKGCTDRGLPL